MTDCEKGFRLLTNKTRRLCMQYYDALGGATALGLWLCLKYKDDVSCMTHSINPRQYASPVDFRSAYMATKFLSKFRESDEETAALRYSRALDKFNQCETRLRHDAIRFRLVTQSPKTTEEMRLCNILHTAREKIQEWIGLAPPCIRFEDCNFGPGASTSVPRSQAHPSKKFLSNDVSDSCRGILTKLWDDIGWRGGNPVSKNYSKLQVVPKNFSADRIIAIEPDWNIFLQKGIGAAIRRCLKAIGLDLNHAAEKHGVMTKECSKHLRWATIDLSSASDSISTWLVRFLLPEAWFVVLNSIRTLGVYHSDGRKERLARFSSMGNGFTFELESLIFYSLCIATKMYCKSREPVSTFGDDMIVGIDCVDTLTEVLTLCSFVVNTDKSFADGLFRESCGEHFFDGLDCKPIYQKVNFEDDPSKFKFCNALRSLAHRVHGCFDNRTRLFHVYNTCRDSIRRVYYIPAGYGDGGLVSTFDEAVPQRVNGKSLVRRYRPKDGFEGWKVKCLLPVRVKAECYNLGLLLSKLRSIIGTTNPVLMKKFESQRVMKILERDFLRHVLALTMEGEQGNEITLGSPSYKDEEEEPIAWRVGHIRVPQWVELVS